MTLAVLRSMLLSLLRQFPMQVEIHRTLAQARNAYDDGLARYRLALASLQTLTGRF